MLAVVAVTAAVAILLASLLYQLSAELASTHTTGRSEQAWQTAMSGVHHAAAVVAGEPFDPARWHDNEALFRHQLVADDGVDRWHFTVFVATGQATSPWRYGVSDEAARLHINEVDTDVLVGLPRMTPSRAEAMQTYLDTGAVGGTGASSDPLDDEIDALLESTVGSGPVTPSTVDELLVVPALNASVMYGASSHAARRLNPRAADDDNTLDADPDSAVGLRHWLTAWSHDSDLDSDGQTKTRIDLSPDTLAEANLPEEAVEYVRALRDEGGSISHPAELLEAEIEVEEDDETRTIASGIGGGELPELLDRFAPAEDQPRRGRVNVNTAPSRVLARVPGIDAELADRITAARDRLDSEIRRTPAWLYTEQLVDAEAFRSMAPHLTARCTQMRLLVVGYAEPAGVYRVVEAVVDLSAPRPQIRYLRDRTQLGLPFALASDDLPGDGP